MGKITHYEIAHGSSIGELENRVTEKIKTKGLEPFGNIVFNNKGLMYQPMIRFEEDR